MLSQEQIDIIIDTMMPYHPQKIGIFGSVARNEDTEQSDIDILYRIENVLTLFDIAGMQCDLEDRLNKKVDLVPEKSIYPFVKENALKDLKIIYEI